MGSKRGACDECSRNCLMIHHKHNDPSQIIPSFFKVMYGKNFSDLLILPPRFVKVNSFLDQETYLENSSGQKWNIVLSTVNGSLAFKKGWHEFVLDHGIQVGDFVAFHYMTRSHFVVQIYGRSGCVKLNVAAESRHKNKRAKTTNDHVVLTCPCDSFIKISPSKSDKNTNPSQKSDTKMTEVAPRAGFSEDSYFMFSRDTSCAHEDDRAHLFDLSTYERLDIKANRMQLEVNGCSENDASKHRVTEANNVDCSSGMVEIKKKLTQELRHNPVEETSFNVSSYEAKTTTILPEVNINTGKVEDNFNHMGKDKDEGETIKKRESDDIRDNSSSLAIKVTCSVKPDSECFLELPEKLPIKVSRRGVKWEKKVVYLRDQVGRQWPVMYHQKNGVFVLTSGWKSYRNTNNIQPGDECTFMVESIDDSIFGVQIRRR